MHEQKLPRLIFIGLALIQGVLLYFLQQSFETHGWLSKSPQWFMPLLTLLIAVPLVFTLSANHHNIKKILTWLAAFSVLIILLGAYVGSQMKPYHIMRVENLVTVYIFTMSIATFKFLIYAQQRARGQKLTYSQLFIYSWRNFLTLALSALFTLVFWGLLMLWAALFKIIGIKFFYNLFTEEWFFFPVLAMVNTFAITIFRSQSKVVDVITRIQQALMKYLLLLIIFVQLIFLFTLPFTGLDKLWETNSGSLLVLWLQALILFFLNAVYQDETSERPYPIILHRFVYFGIALLPVYSVIVFYGLSERVMQYGWTIGRCWGMLIWFVLALFSTGYLWGIIKQRDHWIDRLSWVNIRLGLMVMGLMFLVNTPILDFRKISASSQIARLTSGELDVDDFDFYYFKKHLSTAGYDSLLALKSEVATTNKPLAKIITEVYEKNYWSRHNKTKLKLSKDAFIETLKLWPAGEILPEGFKQALYAHAKKHTYKYAKFSKFNSVIVVDLNGDDGKEYLFLHGNYINRGVLFYQEKNNWKYKYTSSSKREKVEALNEILSNNDIEVLPHVWNDVRIGKVVHKVN